jgi:hypothetical protein
MSPSGPGPSSLVCGGRRLRVSYWVPSEELTAMTTRVEDVMTRNVIGMVSEDDLLVKEAYSDSGSRAGVLGRCPASQWRSACWPRSVR